MNKKEIQLLQEFVKKRFDESGMDYKTFNEDLDETLTYIEQKRIYEEKLNNILPKPIPKLKRETTITQQQMKQQQEEQLREEMRIQEEELKKKFDEDLEKIISIKTSEELEKLYFKPKEFIKMVAKGVEKGLLLFGKSSLGKSYNVKKVLAEQGLKEGDDFFIISGHITPLQFYMKLYYAKEKIIVFDDVNILESKTNLNMLKACLNENSFGKVEYHTSKTIPDNIPSSFIFRGQVIILLNEKPKNSEHLKAVENRIITYELKFTYEEIIRIILDIAKQEVSGTTQEERFEVVKWIKENTNRATKNLNIRMYQHILRFYMWNKDIWKELGKEHIQNDEYITMILQNVDKDKWIEETGLSLATYKRIRKEYGLSRAYGITNGSKAHDFDM